MSELRYIEQDDGGPLCPNADDLRHRLATKMLDAMYDVMDRDPDNNEAPSDQSRLYSAAAKAASNRMNLYVAIAAPSIIGLGSGYARLGVSIEAWYFQCPTCEFMLPAHGIRRS